MTEAAKGIKEGSSPLLGEASTVLHDSRELRDQVANQLQFLNHVSQAVDKLTSRDTNASHSSPHPPSHRSEVTAAPRSGEGEKTVDRQTVVAMRQEQLAELFERNCRIGRMRQGQARMRRDLQASHWHVKQRQAENEYLQQRISDLERELEE